MWRSISVGQRARRRALRPGSPTTSPRNRHARCRTCAVYTGSDGNLAGMRIRRRRRRARGGRAAQELRRRARRWRASRSRRGAGELVACIGPNGAGKTTLLTILAGIQAADAGTVRRATARVGWVPQQPALYGKLSVAENLRLFARLERVADVEAAVARMLAADRARGARGRAGRAALGRQPPAGQRRDRPARRRRRCCCSTSRARRSTRASASACGSSSAALAERGHDGRLLDAHRLGGRALRRPGARAGRRRAALLGHAGGARELVASRRRRPATSSPRSSPSCASAGH